MSLIISDNTKAILLLTAPLFVGRTAASPDLLSPGEYKRLARHLREIQRQPADFISPDSKQILHACHQVIDENRLQRLLGRGFLLSQAIEHWQARSIWVVSRADTEYPRRLKSRLREDAPAVIYGCGDRSLLDSGGLAVVGSRRVDDSLVDYAMSVALLAARTGKKLISGGAKGIDQVAMRGALEAGGKACGVLADSLEKTAMNREHRNLLLDGQLVLISPYDPSAGFNVGNAMQRNKLIYALADVSLVVNSDLKKGGTWAGAVEQLDKLKFVPVFVRTSGKPSDGLDALRMKGAAPWPDPQDVHSFKDVFEVATNPPEIDLALFTNDGPSTADSISTMPVVPNDPSESKAEGNPSEFFDIGSDFECITAVNEQSPEVSPEPLARVEVISSLHEPESAPADLVFAAARKAIHQLLSAPMKDTDVAKALDVSKPQTIAWLQRLVDEGVIEKKTKPVQYVARGPDLFSR